MSADFDGLTFPAYMAAGAAAGIAEHIAMFPVDTVKTRMQALGHPGQQLHGGSVLRALRAILRREGVGGLYGGVGAVALSAGPAHALYFSTYEAAKHVLGVDRNTHTPLVTAAAGAAATIVNDGVMTPADVVKQRLQMAHSPYKGILDCVQTTLKHEGVGAFFRSYRTTLLMNIPFTAVYFSTYESAKLLLAANEEDEGLLVQVVAGGAAGGLAAGLTNPLDVLKTRLQTDSVLSHPKMAARPRSVVGMLQNMIQTEGWGALWRGVSARVWFNVPSAAVCWGVYETTKAFLQDL